VKLNANRLEKNRPRTSSGIRSLIQELQAELEKAAIAPEKKIPISRRGRPNVRKNKGMRAKTSSQAREMREAKTEMSFRLFTFSTTSTAGIPKIFPKKGAATKESYEGVRCSQKEGKGNYKGSS